MNRRLLQFSLAGFLVCGAVARADVTLLLEEPFGTFGGMNPTGHAAIYLSRVCAESPVSLRRCHAGEQGVVISRYHRVGGFDWIAIPVIPYLYAVNRPDQVPQSVDENDVAALRDEYRKKYLEGVVPDESDGSTPAGDWIQLVGSAYDRTLYAFNLDTTEAEDEAFMDALMARPNQVQFHLLYRNCADFAKDVINFYYPKAIHRSFLEDAGIMTPKQAAKCLVHFEKKHSELRFSTFAIAQVPGTVPRSTAVRGVLESLTKSKRYAVPLASLAVLHPYFGGTLAFAWLEGSQFNPRRIAEASDSPEQPKTVDRQLRAIVSF